VAQRRRSFLGRRQARESLFNERFERQSKRYLQELRRQALIEQVPAEVAQKLRPQAALTPGAAKRRGAVPRPIAMRRGEEENHRSQTAARAPAGRAQR